MVCWLLRQLFLLTYYVVVAASILIEMNKLYNICVRIYVPLFLFPKEKLDNLFAKNFRHFVIYTTLPYN